MLDSATNKAPIHVILNASGLILDYMKTLDSLLTKAYMNNSKLGIWPDIIEIMRISSNLPNGNMPYKVDANGALERGADGTPESNSTIELKEPTKDANSIIYSLLEADRLLFLHKTENLDEMQAIQKQRTVLTQLVSRLFGYKGSYSTPAWSDW